MREGFRLVSPELPAEMAWVLVGRSSLCGKGTADVMCELRQFARKLGVSCAQS